MSLPPQRLAAGSDDAIDRYDDGRGLGHGQSARLPALATPQLPRHRLSRVATESHRHGHSLQPAVRWTRYQGMSHLIPCTCSLLILHDGRTLPTRNLWPSPVVKSDSRTSRSATTRSDPSSATSRSRSQRGRRSPSSVRVDVGNRPSSDSCSDSTNPRVGGSRSMDRTYGTSSSRVSVEPLESSLRRRACSTRTFSRTFDTVDWTRRMTRSRRQRGWRTSRERSRACQTSTRPRSGRGD